MTQRPLRTRASGKDARSAGPAFAGSGRHAPRILTFLAIDLAESSTVLAGLGEGRVETSRTTYLSLLRNAVAAHHGRELARQEDSALIVFDTPSEAVACAVAIRRATERHDRQRPDRLDVRIGIHLGEASESTVVSERGEYQARPAIGAEQLCVAAPGGGILASDLVSALVGAEGAFTFERAGLVELEGMAEPVATFEVHPADVPDQRPPLPPGLAGRPQGRCSFVGRSTERERLRAAWVAAASGERHLAFALGEPGIGKSRLSAEFAAEVYADGATVLSGRSFEESIVPYQPFVEALRQYAADCDPARLEVQLGGDLAALAPLLPELATRLGLPAGKAGEDGERYRLFDAVAAFVAAISMSSPVLLVLDDLQWADPATLLLLKHIVLDPRPASLLILGLYRDTEVGLSHPLTQLQADIERDFAVERVTLSGLGDEDVGEMLDEMIGWSPPASVARDLRQDTEGNPFFLQEVIAQLEESGVSTDRERLLQGQLVGGQVGVPSRVRDFVARRVQRLEPESLEVLGVAAVVGTEFQLDILAAVLSADPDRLVDRLEEAVDARLVLEVPGRAGTYAFTHALFQQALYDRHGDNRRALLHSRVAESIESLRGDDPALLSDLARHYALTAERYADKVVHYGAAAGDRAFAQLAYEDAIDEYSRALDAFPRVGPVIRPTKADLLVRLGEAQTRVADAAGAKRSFLAAAEHCAGDCSPDILARAALGYGGTGKFGAIFDPFGVVNGTLVHLLERALEACPHDEGPTRVQLLGWLAQALYWSDDKARMLALSQEALESARRLGDATAIAHALHSRHVALWDPDHALERRAAAQEMLTLARTLGDQDIQLKAYTWLITDALETDHIAVVDGYIADYAGLAAELHRPYLLGYAESMRAARAHLEGRFEDMARSLSAQLAYSEGADALRAQEAHRWQVALLQLDLGRIDDALMDSLAECAATYPGPTFEVMLLLADAIAGRREDARSKLERSTPGDLSSIPRDCMWDGTLAMLSRAVSRLGAVEYARPLYELLAPYAERNCLWGSGFIILGPMSRFVGMLAITLGQPDVALSHLADALPRCRELGSPPLVARTSTEMARALLMRGAEGDEEQARSLLDEATVIATELGMARLLEDTQRLSSAGSAALPQPPPHP